MEEPQDGEVMRSAINFKPHPMQVAEETNSLETTPTVPHQEGIQGV